MEHLSVLTQRAEPLVLDALVDALKKRGFVPRIEVSDGDLLLRDRRDTRTNTSGVLLAWARPAHRERVPDRIGRVVLSYGLSVGAMHSGWDHFLVCHAAACIAELVRGWVVAGDVAEEAQDFVLRLGDQGIFPFGGPEAVWSWESSKGLPPLEEIAIPETAPAAELGGIAIDTGMSLDDAVARVLAALADSGQDAIRWNTESGFDAGPFETLAVGGDANDLVVVAPRPWTDARQGRAIRRLGQLRLRGAKLRMVTAEPLPERLAYLFGMDGRGDLELELLAAARTGPALCAASAESLASLGREALKRRLGVGVPQIPESALKAVDRIILDVLRPTRERTAALTEDAYVPECTLVVLGCLAGEALRAHPALEARWVDGEGMPSIEARRRDMTSKEPAQTSPILRAFDLYRRGVAHRFEALLPRPSAPRPAPTYNRPTPRPVLAISAPPPSGWFDKLRSLVGR